MHVGTIELASLGIGALLGAAGAWFFTAMHWYRKGLRDAGDVWQNAMREGNAVGISTAKDAIDRFVDAVDNAARAAGDDVREEPPTKQ